MKGDGHAGGELLLCASGTIPQQKISTRDKHFTLMPLTLLTGDPLMCILIISGKKPSAATEMEIDQFQEMVCTHDDEEFFKKIVGKENCA